MISRYNQHSPHLRSLYAGFPILGIVKQPGMLWIDRRKVCKRLLEFLVIGVLLHHGNHGAKMKEQFGHSNVQTEPLIQFVASVAAFGATLFQPHEQSWRYAAIDEIVSQHPEVSRMRLRAWKPAARSSVRERESVCASMHNHLNGKAMADYRARRKRRQAKQALKFGRKAKPRHALKAGRTGSKFMKQLASRKAEL